MESECRMSSKKLVGLKGMVEEEEVGVGVGVGAVRSGYVWRNSCFFQG